MNQIVESAVIEVLSRFTSKPMDQIEPQDELYFDLGIGDNKKRLACTEFDKVLMAMQSDNRITMSECTQLKTVKDCIDLVKNRL